jgi:hypothetical protein
MKKELAITDKTKIEPATAKKWLDKLIAVKNHIGKATIALAEILFHIHKEKAWEALGYDSFEELIAQPEIGLSRGFCYALIKIYNTFIIELGVKTEEIESVDITKMRELIKIEQDISTRQIAKEWIQKAKMLSRSDLIAEVKKTLGKTDEPKINTWCDMANHIIKQQVEKIVKPGEITPAGITFDDVALDKIIIQGENFELGILNNTLTLKIKGAVKQ